MIVTMVNWVLDTWKSFDTLRKNIENTQLCFVCLNFAFVYQNISVCLKSSDHVWLLSFDILTLFFKLTLFPIAATSLFLV